MENKKESLFSARYLKQLTGPINAGNPVTVLVLGICPTLGVTVQLKPAIVMAISVLFVLTIANLLISLLRNTIPPRIRIIVQLTVIASLVILVDQVLKAYLFDVSKQLSVFVGLIITNCIIMGRLEAFALGNKPWPSILDGIGNAAGFGMIIIILAFVRELFGSGSVLGYPLFEKIGLYSVGYEDNGLMILPPMALIVVGIFIWIHRSFNKELVEEK